MSQVGASYWDFFIIFNATNLWNLTIISYCGFYINLGICIKHVAYRDATPLFLQYYVWDPVSVLRTANLRTSNRCFVREILSVTHPGKSK